MLFVSLQFQCCNSTQEIVELVKIFVDIDLFSITNIYFRRWLSLYLASDQKSEVVPKFLLKIIVQNMMVVKVVFIEEAKLLIKI